MKTAMELPVMEPGPTLAQLGWKALPAGDYAMPNTNTGRVHFFSVKYGRIGTRWEGFTFLEEHEGPNRRQVRDRDERTGIIKAIERNPLGCIKMFGQQTGECGYCHLELTDPRSLAAGCGKKCANDRGIPW